MTNDYIRRDDALDALKAQADTMQTWVERYAEQRRGVLTAVNIVEDIEPADVVQVVRCRDCKHLGTFRGKFYCRHNCGVVEPKEDDFCSYGERRKG